jgi:proteic killer suppression protein
LTILNLIATQLSVLDAPALHLHALKGDRAGFWAVTVQANWRVIFRFEDDNVYVADYLDYH